MNINPDTPIYNHHLKNTIVRILEILDDETHWTKGEYARDYDRNAVNVGAPYAVCWCLHGAKIKANDEAYSKYPVIQENGISYTAQWLMADVEVLLMEEGLTIEFNDNPDTTHSDIIKGLNRIISKFP